MPKVKKLSNTAVVALLKTAVQGQSASAPDNWGVRMPPKLYRNMKVRRASSSSWQDYSNVKIKAPTFKKLVEVGLFASKQQRIDQWCSYSVYSLTDAGWEAFDHYAAKYLRELQEYREKLAAAVAAVADQQRFRVKLREERVVQLHQNRGTTVEITAATAEEAEIEARSRTGTLPSWQSWEAKTTEEIAIEGPTLTTRTIDGDSDRAAKEVEERFRREHGAGLEPIEGLQELVEKRSKDAGR